MSDILFALWFFLPAGAANMAPVPAAKLPWLKKLNAPLDFGAALKGKRLLGSHKTWRGLAVGVVVAALVVWLQQYLVREFGWFGTQSERIGYLGIPAVLLGLALAVGALGGDAVESFLKRRRGIKPGGVWFPFDLIDHIVGAALAAVLFAVFAWYVYLAVFAVWLVANLLVSYLGYLVGIKERPI